MEAKVCRTYGEASSRPTDSFLRTRQLGDCLNRDANAFQWTLSASSKLSFLRTHATFFEFPTIREIPQCILAKTSNFRRFFSQRYGFSFFAAQNPCSIDRHFFECSIVRIKSSEIRKKWHLLRQKCSNRRKFEKVANASQQGQNKWGAFPQLGGRMRHRAFPVAFSKCAMRSQYRQHAQSGRLRGNAVRIGDMRLAVDLARRALVERQLD